MNPEQIELPSYIYKIHADYRQELVPLIAGIKPGVVEYLDFVCGNYFERRREMVQGELIIRVFEDFDISYGIDDESGFGLYASFEKSNLEKLASGEIQIGTFLGYPACCSEKFYVGSDDYFAGKNRGPAVEFRDLTLQAISKGDYHFELDYVSHVPCSLTCKESIEIGSQIGSLLKEVDPVSADWASMSKSLPFGIDKTKIWNQRKWRKR